MRLIFFLPILLFSLTLKDRIPLAKKGDYVASEQNRQTTVLYVKEILESSLFLEEDTAAGPLPSIPAWVKKGAPGHTSKTLFEIDKKTGNILSAYSFSKGSSVSPDDCSLLKNLFSLPLEKTPDLERKRIGPKPLEEADHRPLWNPSVLLSGAKPQVEAFKGIWPKDASELSHKEIELYLNENFFFPLWVEIHGDHFRVFLKTIEAGNL